MSDSEYQLSGGNSTSVSRVGDTVRRTAGPWTPTIHRLLEHLRVKGVSWVPSPHGLDERGREVLGFIAGAVPTYPMPEWIWADEILTVAASRLRSLHDASEGFDRAGSVWRLPEHHPAEVICHNDFAQHNLVFRDREIVGAIDFDTASPGPRIWDVAYLAHRLIPLNNRDRPADTAGERVRRLNLLMTGYGASFSTEELILTAVTRLVELAQYTDEQATSRSRADLAAHARLYRSDAEALAHWPPPELIAR